MTPSESLLAEQCSEKLSLSVLQSIMDERQWQLFGFRTIPRRGRIWNRFVNKDRLAAEHFLRREFAIIALAIVCESIAEAIERVWAVPVAAGVLDTILGHRGMREAFYFDSLETALDYFAEGVSEYAKVESDSWGEVLRNRSAARTSKEYAWQMYQGSALLMEPTASFFPHVRTASSNICANASLVGKIRIGNESVSQVLDVAERLLRVVGESRA